MSVSALAVVEFPLAAAKIECAEEIHACENLKFTRIDVSSHVKRVVCNDSTVAHNRQTKTLARDGAFRVMACDGHHRAAEVEVEDNEYADLLEARLRRETWRQRERARLKIELESQGVKTEEVPKSRSLKKKNFRRRLLEESRAEIQQAFRATQDLDNDKAAGGEGAEMENETEEKKRVLLQEEQEREREEQRVAGLMQIRRQKLRRAFEAEKVRKELAAVLVLESQVSIGTVLINQGVNGTSTYVIWKGSLDDITNRKGKITTLHEGEDFGQLALINKMPQDISVVIRKHDCHFLRMGNLDFVSILKDVNANIVHVEENGIPALILQRSSSQVVTEDAPEYASCSNNFLVKLGTPAKILQFLLGSIKLNTTDDRMDPFVYNFLLTHHLFMPSEELCSALLNHFHAETSASTLKTKDKIINLVVQWVALYGLLLMDNPAVVRFLEKLAKQVKGHAHLSMLRRYIGARRHLLLDNGHQPSIRGCHQLDQSLVRMSQPIRVKDKVLQKVFRHDHSFVSLRMPLNASVEDVMAAMKIPARDHILVKVKSSGVREQLKMDARATSSFLGLNERIFLCTADQADKLTPLQEQLGPDMNTIYALENMSSKIIAAQLTSYDWELFNAMHETELLFYVLGKKKFPNSPTANLERFIQRFNEVAYWVATELCLCADHAKRARLLKKFITIATILYSHHNMNSFTAVMYGLTNSAVSRLHKTWKKVPNKMKKRFRRYEHMLDPFSNHEAMRQVVAKLSPPYIPYLPLILKDLTFIHEGNKSYRNGLVNFEKMSMIAKNLRTVKDCRNQPYLPISPQNNLMDKMFLKSPLKQKLTFSDQSLSVEGAQIICLYIRNLKVIDDQRKLSQLSRNIEP